MTENFRPYVSVRYALTVSVIVLMACLVGTSIIYDVDKIDVTKQIDATQSMPFLAAVFGVLAGGCISGFFSYTYKEASIKEANFVICVSYSLIFGIFLFVFLSFYCLQKVGVFSFLDQWVKLIIFLGAYAVLNSVVLIERWDTTYFAEKAKATSLKRGRSSTPGHNSLPL